MPSGLESDICDTMDWGRKWLVDFNAGKSELVSFDHSNAIDVKMVGSVLEEVFSIGISLVNVHPNWFNWFHFLILGGSLTHYFDR